MIATNGQLFALAKEIKTARWKAGESRSGAFHKNISVYVSS